MRWRVIKMGRMLFDALHTYGVALVIATLTQQPVTFEDTAPWYELTSPVDVLPPTSEDLFDQLFPLPAEDRLSANGRLSDVLPVTVLDGLLAALLTYPRTPLLSNVHDLYQRQRVAPLTVAQGLQKVRENLLKWKTWVFRTVDDPTNWGAELLDDYRWQTPATPLLVARQSERHLSILMTIDPSFAYSSHQPINLGNMTHKSNVTIVGARFAALLAFVGAARFLRARSVAEPFLLFSVPVLEHGTIERHTSLPLLVSEDGPPDLVLVRQWLALFTTSNLPEVRWHSLAYQLLQKQKRQQPLCAESGHLCYSWLRQIELQAGPEILPFWQYTLQFGSLEERERLVDLLKQQHFVSWYRHLTHWAEVCLSVPLSAMRRYRFEEVRHLTTMMDPSSSHPLRAVLDREQEGTVSFGRALCQLGRRNPALLRDLIELLEPVRTLEELLPVLHRIVLECDLVKRTWRYISVPSHTDFALLLDDIQHHGIRQIIGVLQVLSTLRYSSSEEWKNYESWTLIRVLLWLITVSSEQAQHNGTPSRPLEQIRVDEPVILFPEEETDESIQ